MRHSYLAAALQMTSGPDVEQNLNQLTDLVELACRRGAILIGLPENFAFMGDEQQKATQAPYIATAAERCLRTLAQRFQVTILAGGMPVPADNHRVYNRALVMTPEGEIAVAYDKVHLFDVNLPDGNTYQESRTVVAGAQLPPVYHQPDLGAIGLSICYDVRFPELYRHLAKVGAEILFIPAAFTAYTGKDHWQVLLQARAIENTCYVLAPAQVGWHYPRRQTHGHAMIVDPWGVVLADAGDQPGLAMAEINPERLAQVRRQMPSLQHRVF
ncbi:MAG: carbon-nitrogen hydrolase family protein [Gloeomargarita sp. SKYG116]|nr:carbon-nitrogen hydrolase family protein [Gloeomargarita sp. SKYG116]MDW8401469.1 carbon-nitrogen hydrolase family protein [Gloeomargarita sp. SKYGB_i_bin116]